MPLAAAWRAKHASKEGRGLEGFALGAGFAGEDFCVSVASVFFAASLAGGTKESAAARQDEAPKPRARTAAILKAGMTAFGRRAEGALPAFPTAESCVTAVFPEAASVSPKILKVFRNILKVLSKHYKVIPKGENSKPHLSFISSVSVRPESRKEPHNRTGSHGSKALLFSQQEAKGKASFGNHPFLSSRLKKPPSFGQPSRQKRLPHPCVPSCRR
jgi:hypothetical protein